MKQSLKWQNGVWTASRCPGCVLFIFLNLALLMKHRVWQICIKMTKQASEHRRAISMVCGSHEKCSLKTACFAGQERKIHCILIASPHVIVLVLCFCIFANTFLRMNNISSCVEDCSAALELQPSYSKALHRWRFPTLQYENHTGGDEKFWMLRYTNHIGGDIR